MQAGKPLRRQPAAGSGSGKLSAARESAPDLGGRGPRRALAQGPAPPLPHGTQEARCLTALARGAR